MTRRSRGGNSAVELALVLMVALVLVFAVMDWGWFLFHRMTVTRAAQQGVRLAAGIERDQQPTAVAEAEALRWLSVTGLSAQPVQVVAKLDEQPDMTVLTLIIELPYDPLVGLIPMPDVLRDVASVAWYGDIMEP